MKPTPRSLKLLLYIPQIQISTNQCYRRKNRVTQTRLEKVISYTKQTMATYMSEENLNHLSAYVVEYSSGDTSKNIARKG